MPDLNQRLSEIRELQGKPAMPDPTKIAGFGPGDAPPPPIDYSRIKDDDPEDVPPGWLDPEEEQRSEAPESPLVPRRAPLGEEASLIVIDEKAQYRGRPVVLSEKERATIVRTVLNAVKRDAEDQLKALPKKKT